MEVELVKKVPTNPLSWLLQTSQEQFVRKTYRIYPAIAPTTRTKYLQSEYEILRELQHPNIVQYADFEQKQERGRWTASLYMEYCSGGDLSPYTSRGGQSGRPISERQFWQIFFQVSSALLYCHTGLEVARNGSVSVDTRWRRPVLHRDIKPSNGT